MWRRNPAGDVSILPPFLTTRETEKKILPGFGLTKTGFFLGEFVERQGKSSLKGEGFRVKAHTTEMVPKSDLRVVFANARAVSDRLTWFLHLLLCHRPCEPFPLSSSSQHRI